MYGYAVRREIKARRLTRTDWKALTHNLRLARRRAAKAVPNSNFGRVTEWIRQLMKQTGCDISESVFIEEGSDVLAMRNSHLHADCRRHYDSATRSPTDCCGIPGALRVRLAMQWYPRRAS